MHSSLKNNKYYEPHTHSIILVTTIWSTSPVLQSCVEGWPSHERDEVHVVHQRTVWWRLPSESSSFPSCFLLSSSLNHFNWVRLVQFVTESNELGSEPFAVCLQWACSPPCHHRKHSQRTCSSKTHTQRLPLFLDVSRVYGKRFQIFPPMVKPAQPTPTMTSKAQTPRIWKSRWLSKPWTKLLARENG